MTIAEIIAERKKNNIILGDEILVMADLETEMKDTKIRLALAEDKVGTIDERLKKLEKV